MYNLIFNFFHTEEKFEYIDRDLIKEIYSIVYMIIQYFTLL